jgi:type IV pilus assembly protein PilC
MAEFICKIGTANGEIMQRVYVADSEKTLRQQMTEQGYYIFGIEQKFNLASFIKGFFSFSRKKVSDKEFLIFNQEMAALIRSGLPLLQCLDLVVERSDNPDFTSILDDVRNQVKSGVSLSDAFGSHPDVFPRVYTASILAGEKSGTLEQVIRRYMTYVRITLGIRTKVVSSLIYPALLFCLSMAVIGVLVTYVIPKFSEFYKGFSGELPMITTVLVGIALFAKAHFQWIIGILVVTIIALRVFVKTSQTANIAFDRFKLKLPFLGNLYSKFSISQLMRTLHTLLAGGIPLVNSIDIAAGAVGNQLISRELSKVSQSVKEGEPLWSSLKKTGLMTRMTLEMVKVGEETGALEEMLKNVSDFYDEEIESNLTNVLAVVEPLMLIFMGLLVAGILLAMYYPLFTAIQTIH